MGCGELQDTAVVLEGTRSASNKMLSRWADVMEGGSSGDYSKACVDLQVLREDNAQVTCRAIKVDEEDTVDGVIGGTRKCKGRKSKATTRAKAKQQLEQLKQLEEAKQLRQLEQFVPIHVFTVESEGRV